MYYSESEIEEMITEDMEEGQGEGYYSIEFTDGGEKWTMEGALYFMTPQELEDELRAAYMFATPIHLPYPEMLVVE